MHVPLLSFDWLLIKFVWLLIKWKTSSMADVVPRVAFALCKMIMMTVITMILVIV